MTAPRSTRRQFMRTGLTAATALGMTRLARPAYGILGANERIRIAVAGINGRGGEHIGGFSRIPDLEIAYLIDPDARLFESRSRHVTDRGGKRPECVQDVRKALDDKTLDAISIAAPNHWHSLMTIWACQAGKDVYVEKPLSHDFHEGRVAVEVAKKYKRIVQHGTQRRSEAPWAKAIAAIHSGQLGKLLVARGLCYKRRNSIGFKTPCEVPPELDYNLWTGPRPQVPYHPNLVHYNWHWFWNFGNGDIGNQGVHQLDVARWGIQGATLPKSVISFGGRFGYQDQAETPNTQIAFMDFGGTMLIFEVRGLKTDKYLGSDIGNIFHMESGTIVEGKYFPTGSKEAAPLPKVDAPLGPGDGTYANFIAAVRSRKPSDLNAPVVEGHYSSALFHLANISYQVGEDSPVSGWKNAFTDSDAARETVERLYPHLADNGIAVEQLRGRMGRKLTIDLSTESIVDDPQAAQMLSPASRAPFGVPQQA